MLLSLQLVGKFLCGKRHRFVEEIPVSESKEASWKRKLIWIVWREGQGGEDIEAGLILNKDYVCRRPWFNSWVRKILWRRDRLPTPVFLGFPGDSAGKEFACNVGDLVLIPGLGRSPGEGNGYPLQYSGLKNSMDCIASMGLKRVRHDWGTFAFTFLKTYLTVYIL